MPKIQQMNTQRLGSIYGGKRILISEDLLNSTIICGGAGQDISFDIEFANRFNSKVIIVDPIPKSHDYVNSVLSRIGLGPEHPYNETGIQEPTSYNLESIQKNQIKFLELALWDSVTKITLYPPRDHRHISFSALDIQGTKSRNSGIEVQTTTVANIIRNHSLGEIALIKLDIEGAQFETLQAMFSNAIFPKQLLVEIDELYFPSLRRMVRAKKCINLIKANGYECIGSENLYDFTFLKTS